MTRDLNMLRLVEVTAYNLYLACLVGNPAPRVQRLYERMKAPQVGDLVMEMSTQYSRRDCGTRVGRLLRITSEPMYTPEQWAEAGGTDASMPMERVYYIELPDGQERRWVNASFLAIPTEIYGSGDEHFASDGGWLHEAP